MSLLSECAAHHTSGRRKGQAASEITKKKKSRDAQTAGGHKVKHYAAPMKRTHLSFKDKNEDLNVLESPSVLGSDSRSLSRKPEALELHRD